MMAYPANHERGVAVVMKRAAADQVRPALPQLDAEASDQARERDLALQALDFIVGDACH